MVYVLLFNPKYKRHFEAVVSREDWNDLVFKYGAAWSAAIVISGLHRIKSQKKKTTKTEESYRHFVLNMFYRPDIFGRPIVKVGRNKAEVLHRGRSEFVITSKAGTPYARKPRLYPR
jgi:hypothetical protein